MDVRVGSSLLSLAAAFALVAVGCGPSDEMESYGCDAPGVCDGDDETSGTTGDDDDDDDDATDDGAAAGDIPCEVQDALAANCWSCHSDPVQFGAAMPLATIEDFRVPAVTDPTISVADLVLARIVDTDRPMPPDSSLDDGDRGIIEAWIADGMPGELDADCEGVADDDGEDPYGPENLPCEPSHTFLAHAGDGEEPFVVPETDDLYQCFVFDSPFNEDTQGIAWAPVIDDTRVVHHWLLLKGNASMQNGSIPCSGTGSTFESPMIMGWAPGTPNFVMPEEAGLELPGPDEKVILQIHYNNTAGHADAADRSGVALCTTEEPREQAAGTLWLGSLQIDVPAGGQQEVSYDCQTARLDEPVNLLLNWPHMHEVGSAISTEILRGGEEPGEMLADVPNWNFENQIYYPHDPAVVVEPGDILRTTCNFDNQTGQRVTFGEGTGDEMCFDFAIVYPITAFDEPNLFGPPELGRYCVDIGMPLPWD